MFVPSVIFVVVSVPDIAATALASVKYLFVPSSISVVVIAFIADVIAEFLAIASVLIAELIAPVTVAP